MENSPGLLFTSGTNSDDNVLGEGVVTAPAGVGLATTRRDSVNHFARYVNYFYYSNLHFVALENSRCKHEKVFLITLHHLNEYLVEKKYKF